MSCMSQNCQDNERLALENEELAVAYNNALKEIAILKKYREKARNARNENERCRKELAEFKNEIKVIIESPITDSEELHSAIKDRIRVLEESK